mmetsp:Transcript_75977/g.139109  ORF Transcript_75977/g.139109 Transcript_75977/m.139109 type:complete len:358 (+) Transcript_75977:71-1144(+)
MPLQSAHVFASHIGHTGKTTLCFQMSSYYAKRHPDICVLVMDLAEEGDLTKRFLGGVDAAHEKVDALYGGVFQLIRDAERKTTGLTSWLWSRDVDFSECATQVSKHNPAVPPNLYLVSSGAWPRQEKEMTSEERKRLCAKVKESLSKSAATWKIFCDTDGDRRPSSFTMIGYGLCEHAIVPLHCNKADMDRTETMLGVMQALRLQGEISTQVLFVVWNFVKSLKDEACVHNGSALPFTPSKINLDILDACNKRLFKVSNDLPGLFVHDEADQPTFIENGTAVLKLLADNVLKPSEELGLPFVEMSDRLHTSGKKSMKFKSGSVEYVTKDDTIEGVADALGLIEFKFEAMSISSRGGA